MPQTNHLILELLDCKTHLKLIYEYDPAIIALIKQKQHIFWDDVPDNMQVLDSKRASNQ
jgi:hypothetical protein